MKDLLQNDEDEMAIKFKKFKKAKENSKKKNFGKPINDDQEQSTGCLQREQKQNQSRNSNREQLSGCFKCGKPDHIVKHCLQRKKKQEAESPKKQGRKQAENCSGRLFSKAILAAWEDSTEEEEETEEEDVAIALMARSDSESDGESFDGLDQLKKKVSGLSKTNLTQLFFTFMDEFESVCTENSMLKDVCSDLRKDIRKLEHANKVLKSEKHGVDEKNLVLLEDIEKIKEALKLKEDSFVTDFAKLEKESLDLKERVESLLVENNRLHEKLKQVEIDLATNKRWDQAPQVQNCSNTHHKQGKRDLSSVNKHAIFAVNRKPLDLPENIICFHCGKMGHYRYACCSRKYAMKRNLIHVKQVWIKKDELCISQGMGPKWIWVPKTNL